MDILSFTAVFDPIEDGWIQATIRELPAVITVGRSQAEAKEMLIDAIRELLLAEGHATASDLGRASADATVTERLTLSVA